MKWQEWTTLADNASLWEGRSEKGLLKAEYVDDYILRLWFEDELDVSIYELDFHPLLVEENPGGVFGALKNRERFRVVRGEYALIWPNPETGGYDEQAIDMAPECARFFCERYGNILKKPAKRRQRPANLRIPVARLPCAVASGLASTRQLNRGALARLLTQPHGREAQGVPVVVGAAAGE